MIEIVYNKTEENEGEGIKLKLPKNIKQVGSKTSNRKIYIEDYVMSYINEVAAKITDDVQAGVLLGTTSVSEGERYLFIKGAIKVRDYLFKEGRITLNEQSWTGIYEDIKKYFPALNILGWFVILGDIENLPKGSLEKTHVDNFAGNEKTLFVFECDKGEEGFYFYDNGSLVKEAGYYIYYERNENMQEYMVCDEPEKKENESYREILNEQNKKQETESSSRLLAFMYSVSTFLIVVIAVMGINIMNSNEKLNKLESAVSGISDYFSIQNRITKPDEEVTVVEVAGKVSQTELQTQSQTQTEMPSTQETSSEAVTSSIEPVTKTPVVHVVMKGDSLVSISKKYYGTDKKVNDIMELNNISDADKIYLGQKIKLP